MTVLEQDALDESVLERLVAFHGHQCPGLAMGVQAARLALREVGPDTSDEGVVAVVETDMCGVDAIQFLTCCTFGKGNLVHRDWGKKVFTFFRRSDGKAVRIAARSGALQPDPEHQRLRERISAGQASDADRRRFRELHVQRSEQVLAQDPEELFTVEPVDDEPPRRARIKDSVPCARCGEEVMETRIRRVDGRELCQPCFDLEVSR